MTQKRFTSMKPIKLTNVKLKSNPPDIATILQNEAYIDPESRSRLIGHNKLDQFSDKENVLHRDRKNKIIHWGVRGSVVGEDFLADAELLGKRLLPTLKSPTYDLRIDRANSIYKKLKKQYPDHSISISGHSLGSSVVSGVLNRNPNDNKLEGHGFNGWVSESGKTDDRMSHYASADPVTNWLRENIPSVSANIVKTLNKYKKEIVVSGTIANVLGNYVIPEVSKWHDELVKLYNFREYMLLDDKMQSEDFVSRLSSDVFDYINEVQLPAYKATVTRDYGSVFDANEITSNQYPDWDLFTNELPENILDIRKITPKKFIGKYGKPIFKLLTSFLLLGGAVTLHGSDNFQPKKDITKKNKNKVEKEQVRSVSDYTSIGALMALIGFKIWADVDIRARGRREDLQRNLDRLENIVNRN